MSRADMHSDLYCIKSVSAHQEMARLIYIYYLMRWRLHRGGATVAEKFDGRHRFRIEPGRISPEVNRLDDG